MLLRIRIRRSKLECDLTAQILMKEVNFQSKLKQVSAQIRHQVNFQDLALRITNQLVVLMQEKKFLKTVHQVNKTLFLTGPHFLNRTMLKRTELLHNKPALGMTLQTHVQEVVTNNRKFKHIYNPSQLLKQKEKVKIKSLSFRAHLQLRRIRLVTLMVTQMIQIKASLLRKNR